MSANTTAITIRRMTPPAQIQAAAGMIVTFLLGALLPGILRALTGKRPARRKTSRKR